MIFALFPPKKLYTFRKRFKPSCTDKGGNQPSRCFAFKISTGKVRKSFSARVDLSKNFAAVARTRLGQEKILKTLPSFAQCHSLTEQLRDHSRNW
jgi:hypothetical protein